jgi:hypothetical protein
MTKDTKQLIPIEEDNYGGEASLSATERRRQGAIFAAALSRQGTLLDQIANVVGLSEQGDVPAEVEAEYVAELDAALRGGRDKIDAYIAAMDMLAENASEAQGAVKGKREATALAVQRNATRAERNERELERLKDRAILAIRMLGPDDKGKWRKLEGTSGRAIKVFNVPASIDPKIDEEKVPLAFKRVTLQARVGAEEWRQSATEEKESVEMQNFRKAAPLPWLVVINERARLLATIGGWLETWEIDRNALLKALKEPCAVCKGSGRVAHVPMAALGTEANSESECVVCGGGGTRLIPGAKLLVGRLRVVVE